MEITPRLSAQVQRITGPAAVPADYSFQEERAREQASQDQLDLYHGSATPHTFFQVLDQRIEEVGNQQVLRELVQEQTELDGEPIETRTQTVTHLLRQLPQQAEDAQAHLNIERVRALLAE